ncbi:MAG: N-acetylmuramoyl-L-alanine amidase [Archangium sp.]|nr:N-acetylmuramoyl-L-alanine amidase [Archangium sp.]MDP3152231.1 N-acetylmuramoyl-L-alanine amidase [Archangium sp.]MDP3571076.1 N-acetylmuramoyl-L-alanine amidase [Archangium sp.]
MTARLLLVVMLAGCGVELETASPVVEQRSSPLEATFQAASREYQVPVGVLKAVGYVETRLSFTPNLESGSGGVGVMQLARRGDQDRLGEAMRLTGATEGKLRVDPKANVRGAAAVLRQLFERSQQSDAALDANDVGDWYLAVSNYPGFDSATFSADYAADVFLALETGFSVQGAEGVITQGPAASRWRNHAPVASARRDAVLEYPGGAAWVRSPHYSSGRSSYEFVLIHTMQGSYAGTKSWFQNPSSNVSSHYILRSSDGEVTQMVEHKNTAWHAQCYNGRSIGLEHEGFVQDPARWYTDAMYRESAKLTKWICDRHGIPKTRARIIGHAEVPRACNTGGHTDPGSGWNWSKYMTYVNGSAPTTGTGVLIGAIYTGGNAANRVSGATVTVGSQSVTTGADGLYQFTLNPGSYTATVAKSGFTSTSVTRVVTAGAQAWGSMEINASAATGTLRGKIYVFNPANAGDTAVAVEGAVVTAGGRTVTTASDGMYLFTLPPGTYTVAVSKSGFINNQVSRAVTATTTTWGSVGLSSTSMADTQLPQVAITFPTNEAALDLGRIDLSGTASDDRGAIATVKVALNGGAESDVAVTSGGFSVEVQLRPGVNSITVSAVDAAGNRGSVTTTATYHAGVAGFVHLAGDEATRIDAATVELREPASGTVVSTVTTDASGAYYAPVMMVPADYLVVVKKAGYMTASETVSVTAESRASLNVALTAGMDEAAEATVAFVEPADGATINTDTVTVYGVVTGFDVATVKVNEVAAELLGAGGFSATVPLVEGENVLEATAIGVTGQSAVARITVTRKVSAMEPGMAKGGCGGCSTGMGFETLGLLALALLRRRRA